MVLNLLTSETVSKIGWRINTPAIALTINAIDVKQIFSAEKNLPMQKRIYKIYITSFSHKEVAFNVTTQ
jgi:hypothetical protein